MWIAPASRTILFSQQGLFKGLLTEAGPECRRPQCNRKYPLPDAFFFSELKNDSATALSQQLSRRIIGPTEALPAITIVPAALIAKHDDLSFRFSTQDCHPQRVRQKEWRRRCKLIIRGVPFGIFSKG